MIRSRVVSKYTVAATSIAPTRCSISERKAASNSVSFPALATNRR